MRTIEHNVENVFFNWFYLEPCVVLSNNRDDTKLGHGDSWWHGKKDSVKIKIVQNAADRWNMVKL